jgi:bifunctional non-homologous end joining protein LigD
MLPAPFEPMLVEDRLAPPWGKPGWVFEEKIDGWRTIAYKQDSGVALISRNMRNLLPRFRAVGAAIAELQAPTLILDGEIARFDERQVSHLLYMRNEDGAKVSDPIFVAFDCLFANGVDLREQPLGKRREILELVLKDAPAQVLLARRLSGDWREAWADVKARELEGLIAKREDSIYEPGKRSPHWIKVKHRIRRGWPEEKVERRKG